MQWNVFTFWHSQVGFYSCIILYYIELWTNAAQGYLIIRRIHIYLVKSTIYLVHRFPDLYLLYTIVRSAVLVIKSCYPSVHVASYPTVQCCLWCVACVHRPAGPGCRSRSQLRLSQWPGTAWVAWAADWVIQTQ